MYAQGKLVLKEDSIELLTKSGIDFKKQIFNKLKLEMNNKIEQHFQSLSLKLMRKQVSGSFSVSYHTLLLIRTIVTHSHNIIENIQKYSKQLLLISPQELCIRNITQVNLLLILKKVIQLLKEDTSISVPLIQEGIKEIMDEIQNSSLYISIQSLDHIHSEEIILTIGKSSTVEMFLKEAAKTRKFIVIVAEVAPL